MIDLRDGNGELTAGRGTIQRMMNKSPRRSPSTGCGWSAAAARCSTSSRSRCRAAAVTGLLGPSGCGKTTLMRAIVGVQKVAGGDVQVLGRPAGSRAAALPRRLRHPGAVGLRRPHRRARTCATSPPCSAHRRATSTGWSARSTSRSYVDSLTGALSGGQRARVSLAAALLGTPELLVLDEPTVGLDPVLRRDLWQLFHELADAGATLLDQQPRDGRGRRAATGCC